MVDITVCIPAYNCANTIERAVGSILKQTLVAEIEILLCDDGSSDNTLEILEALAQSHPEVRVLRNNRNRGRPYTRNRLIDEARGTYVTWLDADDEKYPQMMEQQYNALESIRREEGEDGLDGTLVFTNFDWLWPDKDEPIFMQPPEASYHMEYLLNAQFGGYLWLMMGSAETFRTVGGFDRSLPRLQDLDFFIRFVQKGGKFRRVESAAPLCVYYKDDRARGAMDVWRSWAHIWRKHRLLFYAYGYDNALKWRHHHYRVSRRFAKANNDLATYYRIAAQEIILIGWKKLRSRLPV